MNRIVSLLWLRRIHQFQPDQNKTSRLSLLPMHTINRLPISSTPGPRLWWWTISLHGPFPRTREGLECLSRRIVRLKTRSDHLATLETALPSTSARRGMVSRHQNCGSDAIINAMHMNCVDQAPSIGAKYAALILRVNASTLECMPQECQHTGTGTFIDNLDHHRTIHAPDSLVFIPRKMVHEPTSMGNDVLVPIGDDPLAANRFPPSPVHMDETLAFATSYAFEGTYNA